MATRRSAKCPFCHLSFSRSTHSWQIIADSPFPQYISLEYYTHRFRQPSIIARFEAFARNHSKPLTIIGTHFDASNYLFPLLPAPGADDDASGTVTLLEAFRVLVNRGFIPEKNPVEFHWYAGEETGLLGSLDVAQWNKDSNNLVGSVLDLVGPCLPFLNRKS